MTTKKTTAGSKGKKLKLKKETLKDLEARSGAKIKGQRGVRNEPSLYTIVCPCVGTDTCKFCR